MSLPTQDFTASTLAIPTHDLKAVVWLLCHYPDTEEADERVRAACSLYRALGLPFWLFGTATARYQISVERLLKEKLVAAGIPAERVVCSSDRQERYTSLDTVQEAYNAAAAAFRDGITTLVCVSNRLQLLQVRCLLKSTSLRLVLVPTRLRDWRWWYVAARLLLIPLAFMGVGPQFAPLVFVRWARSRMAKWPF